MEMQAEQEKEKLLSPEKWEEKKKKRRKKAVLMFLGELAIIAAIILTAFQIVRAVGKNSLTGKAQAAGPELVLVKAQAAPLTEEEEAIWQEGWVKHDGKIYAYNEDILTFLIMGIDKDSDAVEVAEGTNGGQADALFLAVMNPHDKSISIIGINRNTMTDIDLYNEEGAYVNTVKAQIAVQHGFGNGVEKSCEYQKKAVQKLFYNLPVHGYAAINMSAIPTINDAVGGVEVTVLEDLTWADSSLKEGEAVHLMGRSAYIYIRKRDTSLFGSADRRLERQKQYLNAFMGEAKQAVRKDISVVFDLYNAVSAQMVTDITMDEIAYLAPTVADYRFDGSHFYMLEGETVMGEQFEEFYADEEALYELILKVFYEEVES